jgi:putative ATPase
LVILASEDIGNADPQGIVVATSCLTTVQQIGLPEGRIALAQATVYLACAPKSNAAYLAINQAMDDVKNGVDLKVPYYLKSNPIKSSKPTDDPGYQYPHAYPNHYVKQAYLPEKKEYLKLSKLGYERVMGEYLRGLDATVS